MSCPSARYTSIIRPIRSARAFSSPHQIQSHFFGPGAFFASSFISRRCYHPSVPSRSSQQAGWPAHSRADKSRPRDDTGIRNAILAAALKYVPTHGFTNEAITLGLRDAGYPDVTTSIFSSRIGSPGTDAPSELVFFHLRSCRQKLADLVQQLEQSTTPSGSCSASPSDQLPFLLSTIGPLIRPDSLGNNPRELWTKIKAVMLARFWLTVPFLSQYSSALGLLALPYNLPASVYELSRLSDQMLALAGDRALDSRWYTRRASVAAVYAAMEAYMLSSSTNFPAPSISHTAAVGQQTSAPMLSHSHHQEMLLKQADRFLTDRLGEIDYVEGAAGDVGQFLGFGLRSVVNIARSRGVWI